MKKRKFICDECPNKKFVNTRLLATHFKKYPEHRNHRQQVQFEYSQAIRDKAGRVRPGIFKSPQDVLPMVKATRMKRVRTALMKFCTGCGNRTLPSYTYCGGCGIKL